MTRGHRRWHYWTWIILTPVIIALLLAALVIRPEAAP
jgi:hypothetical protein